MAQSFIYLVAIVDWFTAAAAVAAESNAASARSRRPKPPR